MSISRITKCIAVIGNLESFDQAQKFRSIDVDFILPTVLSPNLEAMVETATALVLRSFTGIIRVHGRRLNSTFRKRLELEANKLDAAERLDFVPSTEGQWALAFGCRNGQAICGDCSGWTARINNIFEERSSAAPPVIAFTAACMVAKLFNAAILGRKKEISEVWEYCLLRFNSTPLQPIEFKENLDLGKIGLLGAGAIGSAVGYILVHSQFSGSLTIIDSQTFEEPNLETCILANSKAVNIPSRKAEFLAQTLSKTKIEARFEMRRIERPDDALLAEQWDAFICGVDNSETRRKLDETNTNVLLNAGLGDSKEDAGFVLWSRHSKANRPLSALYKPKDHEEYSKNLHIPMEFREQCSRMNYQDVSMSIPFIALAAGSLLVASLCQARMQMACDYNYIQIDMFAKQQRMTRKT